MSEIAFLPITKPLHSLAWLGDELVDLVGGSRWTPEGVEHPPSLYFGDPFDRASLSSSGRHAVIYTERGTKALVLGLDGPRLVRELNRTYYHAGDYDYPIALGTLFDGRDVVVHCPNNYNVLEIEDLESGRLLAAGSGSRDVFHSRLDISPDGRHLLVAGWVWHPYGTMEVYDLGQALGDPASLDRPGVMATSPGADAEVAAACWLSADRVAVATNDEVFDDEEHAGVEPRHLGVWSLAEQRWVHRSPARVTLGTMLPRRDTVVSLYGHPSLIDVATGRVVDEWPDVRVPEKDGSFGVTHVPTPTAALSHDGKRLAVAQEGGIAVITLPTTGT